MPKERTYHEEAMRYIENAKDELIKAKLTSDGNYYYDEKYVKSAGGIAYAGVEKALKWLIKLKGIEIKGNDADAIKEGLSKINKKLLKLFNTANEQLHKAIYYGSETKKRIVDDAISVGVELINELKIYKQPARYEHGAKINPMETKETYETGATTHAVLDPAASGTRTPSEPYELSEEQIAAKAEKLASSGDDPLEYPDTELREKFGIEESFNDEYYVAKGGKIPTTLGTPDFYYLKTGNIVKDRLGNPSEIIGHTKEGIVLISRPTIPNNSSEVEMSFEYFLQTMDGGLATIEGCSYSKDDTSNKCALRHEIAMIKLLNDISAKEAQMESQINKMAAIKMADEAEKQQLADKLAAESKTYEKHKLDSADTIAGIEAMQGGGAIKDQYKGKTAEEIWNTLTEEQRLHFLHDHFTGQSIGGFRLLKWDDLNSQIKNKFGAHVMIGQYAGGGATINPVENWLWAYLCDTAYKIDYAGNNLFYVELQKDATIDEVSEKINSIKDIEIIKGVTISAPFIADGVDADEGKRRGRTTLRVLSNIDEMAGGGKTGGKKLTKKTAAKKK